MKHAHQILLMASLAVGSLSGCELVNDSIPARVVVSTDKASYVTGDRVSVRIANDSPAELEFHWVCGIHLLEQTEAGWESGSMICPQVVLPPRLIGPGEDYTFGDTLYRPGAFKYCLSLFFSGGVHLNPDQNCTDVFAVKESGLP